MDFTKTYTLQRFSSVQSLSHVRLSATPCTAAHQASLSITNSQSLLKLMSIALVMPSHQLILWHPLLLLPSVFPSITGSFPISQFFASSGQSTEVSPSASSVLSMNIQDWFPLGWTGWISLQSKGFSRVFSNATVQKHQFFSAQLAFFFFSCLLQLKGVFSAFFMVQLSHPSMTTGKTIALTRRTFKGYHQVKRQPTEWEKIRMSDKRLVSRIYKNSYNKTNNQTWNE